MTVEQPAGAEATTVDQSAAAEATDETDTAAALALAREALIAANPDAVAELIGGATVAELRASVATARQAHARVADGVRARLVAEAVSPGAVTRSQPIDLAALSPSAKIALALRQRDAAG